MILQSHSSSRELLTYYELCGCPLSLSKLLSSFGELHGALSFL